MASGSVAVAGEFVLRWMGEEEGWELHKQSLNILSRDIEVDDDPLEACYEYLESLGVQFTIEDVIQVIFIGDWGWHHYSTQDGEDGDSCFEFTRLEYRKFNCDELDAFYADLEIWEESDALDHR